MPSRKNIYVSNLRYLQLILSLYFFSNVRCITVLQVLVVIGEIALLARARSSSRRMTDAKCPISHKNIDLAQQTELSCDKTVKVCHAMKVFA